MPTTHDIDGSVADFNAKVALASDGDTIQFPSTPVGSPFVWASNGSTSGKYLKLVGQGAGKILGESESPVTIGTGAKTFGTQEAADVEIGQDLYIQRLIQSSNWMRGTVTSYDMEWFTEASTAGKSYGPTGFKYGAGTDFVTGVTGGTPLNSYTGFMGMKFTVGASPITVSDIGRIFINGNNQTHTVKIVNADGSAVAGASVSLSMVGGVNGEVKYTALDVPVVLSAGTSYFLLSSEEKDGDAWYTGSITTTAVATVDARGYSELQLVMDITSSGGSGTHDMWWIGTDAATEIAFGMGADDTMLSISESAVGHVELSGIRLSGGASGANLIRLSPASPGGLAVLFHDFYLQPRAGAFGIRSATTRGVFWNVYADDDFSFISQAFEVGLAGGGAADFQTPSTIGADDVDGNGNFYIEDFYFVGFSTVTDFEDATRAVVRRGRANNCGFGSHGVDSAITGMKHVEFYDVTFLFWPHPGQTLNINQWFLHRNATTIFCDCKTPNLLSSDYGQKSSINMQVQQLRRNAGPNACWAGGYPAPVQIGWNDDGAGPVLKPCYFWNNLPVFNPGMQDFAPDECGGGPAVSGYVVENREFYNNGTVMPGYTKKAYPHPFRPDAGADVTAPNLVSATVNAAGTTVTFLFDEPVTFGAGGSGGWAPSLSGGAVAFSYASGGGTASLVYAPSRTIYEGPDGTVSFVQAGDGLKDAHGNELENILNAALINDSTQVVPVIVTTGFPTTCTFPAAPTWSSNPVWRQ